MTLHLRLHTLVLAVLGLLAPIGCSDLTATVSGKVYLDDKPLKVSGAQRGMVVFRPVAGGPTCSGLIDADGQYRISTGSKAAVAPGDYMVSARVMEVVPSPNSNRPPTGRPLTPAVYGDPLTSGLTTTVKRGANQYDLKLKSSAGPAVEPVASLQEPTSSAGREEEASAPSADGTTDDDQRGAESTQAPTEYEPPGEADELDSGDAASHAEQGVSESADAPTTQDAVNDQPEEARDEQ